MLSRFLEMPLRAFDRFVYRLDSSPDLSPLRPYILVSQLKSALVLSCSEKTSRGLGRIRMRDGSLEFLYCSNSFVREYLFDEQALEQMWEGLSRAQVVLLSKMKLVNTRNRLTQALIQSVIDSQENYLRTGNNLFLVPLTQTDISTKLISKGELPMTPDPGRISRLVRGLSIMLLNDQYVALEKLFPKSRQILCYLVNAIVKKEKSLIAKGELLAPLKDGEIARKLDKDYDIHVSCRTVANVRRDLAIPDFRNRGQSTNYMAATAGFSALLPLTQFTLRNEVPVQSGVYEIQSGDTGQRGQEEKHSSPQQVVYIGSALDLRKRLADHLRGSSGNELLHRHIVDGEARVRYRLIRDDWRAAERELYNTFCDTFGSPPACNRMSP